VNDALDQPIPKELFDIYDQVMERLRHQGYFDLPDLAIRILSWIFHAQRPLQMSELREAIAIRDGDVDLKMSDLNDPAVVVEACGGFVVHDTTGWVRFTHEQVNAFLQDRHIDLVPKRNMAISCLTYLTFETFEDGPCQDEASFNIRLQERPFGRYAASYWGKYIKGSGEKHHRNQKLLVTLTQSSARKDSIAQLSGAEKTGAWDLDIRDRNKGLLHILAENNLTLLAEMILDGTIFSVISHLV
jgi:hypothetical protein